MNEPDDSAPKTWLIWSLGLFAAGLALGWAIASGKLRF